MTSSSVKVSVIIPNWNGRHWLEGCLNALDVQDYHDFEIVVVDDASTDTSIDYIQKEFPGVKVISRIQRSGFAKTANAGIAASSGEYVLLLNNDTVPSVSFISDLVNFMDNMPPDVGSLASCMLRMDDPGYIDNTGDFLTWYGQAFKRGNGKPVSGFMDNCGVFSACAGAALYRRTFLNETEGFDEKFVNYLEDVDLGLRGRLLGYRCWFVAQAEVLHKGHGSNIPGREYVRSVTRNRLSLIGKNIPLSLVIRHIHHLVTGQVALAIQYRQPLDSIIGVISFLSLIPHVIRERQRITSKTKLSSREIEQLLVLSPEGILLPGWLSGKGQEDVK